jgi:hypothetical protein
MKCSKLLEMSFDQKIFIRGRGGRNFLGENGECFESPEMARKCIRIYLPSPLVPNIFAGVDWGLREDPHRRQQNLIYNSEMTLLKLMVRKRKRALALKLKVGSESE